MSDDPTRTIEDVYAELQCKVGDGPAKTMMSHAMDTLRKAIVPIEAMLGEITYEDGYVCLHLAGNDQNGKMQHVVFERNGG
jgi:hypothetical protein